MHVPFRIHYRNNLIDKKDSYPIPRSPSWDDRNCSYGHQLYPSDYLQFYESLNSDGLQCNKTNNHLSPQFIEQVKKTATGGVKNPDPGLEQTQ